MKKKSNLIKLFLVIQTALLGLLFFLDLTHTCSDPACEICCFISFLEYALRFVYILFASAYVAINIYESVTLGRAGPKFEPFEAESNIQETHIFSVRKETLVNLKVKLLVAM